MRKRTPPDKPIGIAIYFSGKTTKKSTTPASPPPSPQLLAFPWHPPRALSAPWGWPRTPPVPSQGARGCRPGPRRGTWPPGEGGKGGRYSSRNGGRKKKKKRAVGGGELIPKRTLASRLNGLHDIRAPYSRMDAAKEG